MQKPQPDTEIEELDKSGEAQWQLEPSCSTRYRSGRALRVLIVETEGSVNGHGIGEREVLIGLEASKRRENTSK